jgi:hypothetical protein
VVLAHPLHRANREDYETSIILVVNLKNYDLVLCIEYRRGAILGPHFEISITTSEKFSERFEKYLALEKCRSADVLFSLKNLWLFTFVDRIKPAMNWRINNVHEKRC